MLVGVGKRRGGGSSVEHPAGSPRVDPMRKHTRSAEAVCLATASHALPRSRGARATRGGHKKCRWGASATRLERG